jgi:putative ABC transport system permease protein
MHTLIQDVRFAFRMLLKSPGLTSAAIVCLALGIGATTAIFSVVNAVLLRPLAYSQPQELIRVYSEFPNFPGGGLRKFWISPPEYLDLRREVKSWRSLHGWVNAGVNLAGAAEPLRVTASYVTGDLLADLGVSPVAGRVQTQEDDKNGAPLTVVLAYGLWQRAFGGDRGIVGKTVQVNGGNATVIGVMPIGFQFPPGEADPPEIWLPLQIDPANPGGRGSHFLSMVGRLKPGVGIDQARSELAQLVGAYGRAAAPNTHSFDPKNHTILVFGMRDEVVGGVKTAMLMLLGAVGFVLLISCVNVANLLIARAEARQREMAVRKAIGAPVARLLRQFITEGLILSIGGAAAGILLAYAGLRVIVATGQGSIPRAAEIGLHPEVLAFTLLVSVATGLVFGLTPLLQLGGQDLQEALKAAAGRNTATAGVKGFRQALVVGELALALMLLIGTGLMLRAFWKLQQVNVGVDPKGILTMRIALPQALYPDGKSLIGFWRNLSQRVSSLPGVSSATFAAGLPPARQINANDTQIEGWVPREGGPIQNIDYYQTVGEKYFETMRIPLIEGRTFDERDGESAPPTLIVNQTLARTYWPGQSAIGHRMKPGFTDPWRTVVGVVADVKNAAIDKPAGTELYIPYRQGFGLRNASLILKTPRDPESLASAARGEIRAVDAALPVSQVRTMDQVIGRTEARPRFLTLMLTLFSCVALGLAAVGLYGVISYSVARRTTEIGIRIAMGAEAKDVLRMVVGQGAAMGLAGVVIGLAGAVGLTRFIKGLLFGIDSLDPATFACMAALLLAVTLLACYVPARRATKVDPMVALRYE